MKDEGHMGEPSGEDAEDAMRDGSGGRIYSHLFDAIVVTLFFFPPLGIVGIVYASKVKTLLRVGDIEGARKASRKAGISSILGLSVGLLFYTAVLVFDIERWIKALDWILGA